MQRYCTRDWHDAIFLRLDDTNDKVPTGLKTTKKKELKKKKEFHDKDEWRIMLVNFIRCFTELAWS